MLLTQWELNPGAKCSVPSPRCDVPGYGSGRGWCMDPQSECTSTDGQNGQPGRPGQIVKFVKPLSLLWCCQNQIFFGCVHTCACVFFSSPAHNHQSSPVATATKKALNAATGECKPQYPPSYHPNSTTPASRRRSTGNSTTTTASSLRSTINSPTSPTSTRTTASSTSHLMGRSKSGFWTARRMICLHRTSLDRMNLRSTMLDIRTIMGFRTIISSPPTMMRTGLELEEPRGWTVHTCTVYFAETLFSSWTRLVMRGRNGKGDEKWGNSAVCKRGSTQKKRVS